MGRGPRKIKLGKLPTRLEVSVVLVDHSKVVGDRVVRRVALVAVLAAV